MSEVQSVVDRGLKRALEMGADEAEISVNFSKSQQVKSEGPYPKVLSRFTADVWVRVAVGKRVAVATATSADWTALERAVAAAVEMARKAEEDPHWSGLPDYEPPRHNWVGFDEGVAYLEIHQLTEIVSELISEAQRLDPRVKVGAAGGSTYTARSYTYNSRGVKAEDRGTAMHLFLWLKSSDGAREGTGGASIGARSLVYDTTPLLEKARRLALDSLKGEKLGQVVTGNVLFRAEPLAELLENLLVPALSAMNVLEGFSPLKGKIGEKVLGTLTIIDDGTMPGGLSTSIFDAEGVPRRRTIVLENGVLKSYLHNTYTARRMGVTSTGNAARVRGAVGVASSNLLVRGGNDTEESLVAESKIVVDGTLLSVHTVNFINGNFSVVASNPYLVKNGDLVPLRPVTVSGNIYSIGDKLKPALHVKNTFTGIYTPDVLFGGVTVSG